MACNPKARFNGQANPKQTLYRFSGNSVLVVWKRLDKNSARGMAFDQAADFE
ncbi:hypothetical protein [Altererythrobacter lutimaris]|nr:hypothetical protein [Altererythrobacter lutimaris]